MTYPLAPTAPNLASCTQFCGLRRARDQRTPRTDTIARVLRGAARASHDAVVVDPRLAVAELEQTSGAAPVEVEVVLVDQGQRRLERDLVRAQLDAREGEEARRPAAARALDPDEPVGAALDERLDGAAELDTVQSHGERQQLGNGAAAHRDG